MILCNLQSAFMRLRIRAVGSKVRVRGGSVLGLTPPNQVKCCRIRKGSVLRVSCLNSGIVRRERMTV